MARQLVRSTHDLDGFRRLSKLQAATSKYRIELFICLASRISQHCVMKCECAIKFSIDNASLNKACVNLDVRPESILGAQIIHQLESLPQATRMAEKLHKDAERVVRRSDASGLHFIQDTQGIFYTMLLRTTVQYRVVHDLVGLKFVIGLHFSKNIPCNTITYNTMLDACAKCCSMDRTSNLLEDMRESSVEPDIITYSTIVKGYCLEGDVDRAFQVLEDMKSDDKFAPDEILYNSILDGCSKQHRVDDALRLLEEMKSAGVVPSNYTLSILVKLLGHARRLSQAFKMVEELSQQHGFRPNVQVYTCLVQACLLNRKLDRALALHDTMVADTGCWTDEKFYAVLARGCMQLHQPFKAIEVVRAAYQLPGHSMATPARKGKPSGVESRALDEIVGRLRSGGKDENEALASLSADLLEHRGMHLSEGQAQHTPGNRRPWTGGDSRRGQQNAKGAGKGKGKW